MTRSKQIALIKSLLSNPQAIKVKPSINFFLLRYLRKFRIQNIDGNFIIHSHLPPLNSKAYTRFVNEHLLKKSGGPSHAQIGLTNACPQRCVYCYNRDRKGIPMDKATMLRVIQDLKNMGVVWLGFTGGEPLLNKDIVEITEMAAEGCAVKLFTTGCTLTEKLASDLKKAGLFSVSVSLDHWQEEEHDRVRGYKGAFETALKAIAIFKNLGGIQVGVSAVLSKQMIQRNEVKEFLDFLKSLEIHEAWLSETKPSVEAFWNDCLIISEEERLKLVRLQDTYNKENKMTINYLGHFEGREHFGCNAGHKMVYVDAFGEVSPCVFTPFSFGNVKESSIQAIFREMRAHFSPQQSCFINKNYKLLRKYSRGRYPIQKSDTLEMMKEVCFGPMAKFFQLYYQ